jgi:hypothetical protein
LRYSIRTFRSAVVRRTALSSALLVLFALSAPVVGRELAIGDSLAVGLQDKCRLGGNGQIGRRPAGVLQVIETFPPGQLAGATVILSSGASNDPEHADVALLQIARLKLAGAHVVLLGVGDGVRNYQAVNRLLIRIATVTGIPFVYGWHGVHPTDYPAVLAVALDSARRLAARGR